jgi:DNA mismatch repair protein MutH
LSRRDPKGFLKKAEPATVKLVLSLTPELKEALIKKARQVFGSRKGNISTYVEMVLRQNLDMKLEGVEET